MLEHHGVLPVRDESLARFESWLVQKLDGIASPAVRAPLEQFATWHHLRRLRAKSTPRRGSAPATSYAKQEITEAIKFLTWLHEHHHRSAADCTQKDVDEWLNSGPSTRVKIQGILCWANRTRLNNSVQVVAVSEAPYSALTQEQRLAWIKELVVCEVHALPSRIAGILLLLYGQPLTKIAGLRTSAVTTHDDETRILLGDDPIPVPEPFATMLNNHLAARPNLQAAGGGGGTTIPWLFPGMSPGHHLTPQHIMRHLRHMGIHLRGARNTALQSMVVEVPPPIVAEMLGYGRQVHPAPCRHRGPNVGPLRHVKGCFSTVKSQPIASGPRRRISWRECELGPWHAIIRDAVTMKQFRRGELVFDVIDSGPQTVPSSSCYTALHSSIPLGTGLSQF